MPSTSLTMAVSDFGPESSTDRMDLAESLRMVSNSSEDMEGTGAALVMVGARRKAEEATRRLERRVRRCIVLLLGSSWRLFGVVACNCVFWDKEREEVGMEKPDTVPSLIERATVAISGNNFIVVVFFS